MVLGGLCAVVEKDFKKIVAMSTLSQLGMMFFIMSLGIWKLCFLHMVIHAFFKRILFLGTGSIIGQVGGLQDSRFYGAGPFIYFSYVYFLVSCFCLSGFPFFIGFYSKDAIISIVSFVDGILFYYFFIGGCMFTVVYRLRLLYLSFFSFYKFFCFSSFGESVYFFFSVCFIFLKCFLLGGVFY